MKEFFSTKFGRATAVVSVVVAGLAFAPIAGADAVDTGFTTAQTSILGYLGDAVALVLAVFILGLGIRMLIKWAHRAVAST